MQDNILIRKEKPYFCFLIIDKERQQIFKINPRWTMGLDVQETLDHKVVIECARQYHNKKAETVFLRFNK